MNCDHETSGVFRSPERCPHQMPDGGCGKPDSVSIVDHSDRFEQLAFSVAPWIAIGVVVFIVTGLAALAWWMT